jgi:hypothetical protein
LASQLLAFEQWHNVVRSTGAVTPVFFDNTYLLRMNQGTAERVHEDTRSWLPLTSPTGATPRVFAAGPSNTIAFHSETTPMRFQSIGSEYALTLKAPLPTVKRVVTGGETHDYVAPVLIVSTSGVANIWFARSIYLERGPALVKSLMNMSVARFDERSEHLFVAYSDGGIDRYELTAGVPTMALPARGIVKAIAIKWSIAVADDKGVRWFDDETGKVQANLPLPNVVAMEYGDYPTWMHQSAHALLAITSTSDGSKHVLHALSDENGGRELRRFTIPLPRGEKPVALTTTPREVLVATDKGGLWQLWIH